MRAVLRGPLGRKAGLGDGAGAGFAERHHFLFDSRQSFVENRKILVHLRHPFFFRVTGGDVEVGLLSRLTVDFHSMFARWCEERGRNRQAVLSGGVVADQ